MDIEKLAQKIMNGYDITKNEAIALLDEPLDELTSSANRIRKHYLQDNFDACTIINVKSGRCGEDCIFCSQSIHYNTDITEYPLLKKGTTKNSNNRHT